MVLNAMSHSVYGLMIFLAVLSPLFLQPALGHLFGVVQFQPLGLCPLLGKVAFGLATAAEWAVGRPRAARILLDIVFVKCVVTFLLLLLLQLS